MENEAQSDGVPVVDGEGADGTTLALDVELGKARFHAEGAGAVVLEAFQHFRDFYGDHASATDRGEELGADATTTAGGADKAGKKSVVEAPPAAASDVPLSVFLDRKKLPRGNAAVALAIALWAKRHKGEDDVDVDTVKTYWKLSKRKVPANIPRDLGSAASEGWLERLATGKYSVTGYGEKTFDDLPSPDA